MNAGHNDQDYQATMRREKFKATAIWNDMVAHLRRNIVVKRRRWKMKLYENCFPGSEAITVLQTYVTSHPDLRHTVSRVQLRSLCQIFMEKRILESVEERPDFEDGSKLYRFADVAYSKTGPHLQQDLNRWVSIVVNSRLLFIFIQNLFVHFLNSWTWVGLAYCFGVRRGDS